MRNSGWIGSLALAGAILCNAALARAEDCPEGSVKIGEQRTETATAITIQPLCRRIAAPPAAPPGPAVAETQQQLAAPHPDASAPGPAATAYGVVAAVRGNVRIVTKDGRSLAGSSGVKIPLDGGTAITTGPKARLQLLLPDQTMFTLGPNSSMVLDDFVYDSTTGAGGASIKAFRFITAKIKHAGKTEVRKISVDAVGIRG